MANTDKQTSGVTFPTSNGIAHPSVVSSAAAIHSAVDRLAEAARPAVDRLAAGTHQTVDRLADVATSAAHTIKEKQKTFIEAQSRLTENTRLYVTHKPLTAVGLAVAGGFLLSMLLSRK